MSKLLYEVRKNKKTPIPVRDDDDVPVDIVPDFEYNDSNDDMSTSSDESVHLESDFCVVFYDLIFLPEFRSKGEKYCTNEFCSLAFYKPT